MKAFPMFCPQGWVWSVVMTGGIMAEMTTLALPGLSQTLEPAPLSPTATLQMGTEADYVPFAYQYASDPPSGIVGFDIEIARLITQRLGLDFTIQERPFDALLPALQAGELDFAIAAITPTAERQTLVDFSEPYFESQLALVSRRSNPLRTLADLSKVTVAVQNGSIQHQEAMRLKASGVDIEIQVFERVNDMITAIRDQTVDVALLEELVAEAYLENNPSLEFDVMAELPPLPVAIAFPKGSPYVEPFNQVIRELRTSGELDQLTRQWFTSQP